MPKKFIVALTFISGASVVFIPIVLFSSVNASLRFLFVKLMMNVLLIELIESFRNSLPSGAIVFTMLLFNPPITKNGRVAFVKLLLNNVLLWDSFNLMPATVKFSKVLLSINEAFVFTKFSPNVLFANVLFSIVTLTGSANAALLNDLKIQFLNSTLSLFIFKPVPVPSPITVSPLQSNITLFTVVLKQSPAIIRGVVKR